MKYMLDTNICIQLIRGKRREVREHFRRSLPRGIAISVVVYAELQYGLAKGHWSEKNRAALNTILDVMKIVPLDSQAADEYAAVRCELEKRGCPIGPFDTMIAAHARAKDLTLVTDNLREFSRVEGLPLENWVERR